MMRLPLAALALLAATAVAFAQLPEQGGGAPSGAAGGSLGGTYPNPTVVTNANQTGDVTSVGNATTLAAGSASNLNSGTLAAARGGAGAVNGALKANGSGLVTQAACADLSNSGTACPAATGTSGATIPLLNGANTWSGVASSGGNIFTHATQASFVVGVYNTNAATGSSGMRVGVGPNSSDTTSSLIQFTDGGQNTVQGTITRNGSGAVLYNLTSDHRLKENIRPSVAGLADLMKIKVVDYNVIGDSQRVQGYIAQDLARVYPAAVHVGTDERSDQGNLSDPWGADYGRVTPLLVKSIQDLAHENAALKRRLDELEGRVRAAQIAR